MMILNLRIRICYIFDNVVLKWKKNEEFFYVNIYVIYVLYLKG